MRNIYLFNQLGKQLDILMHSVNLHLALRDMKKDIANLRKMYCRELEANLRRKFIQKIHYKKQNKSL